MEESKDEKEYRLLKELNEKLKNFSTDDNKNPKEKEEEEEER